MNSTSTAVVGSQNFVVRPAATTNQPVHVPQGKGKSSKYHGTPGHPNTHAPKMTPEKRERIAKRIRARQQAAELAAEQPLTSSAQRANYPLGEFMGSMAESLWTQTEWIAGKLYEWMPSSDQADDSGQSITPPEAGHLAVTSSDPQCTAWATEPAISAAASTRSTTSPEKEFQTACVNNGFSQAEIEQIAAAWKLGGIPLNGKTAPVFSKHNLVKNKLASMGDASTTIDATHYRGVFEFEGQQKRYWIKCYARPDVLAHSEDLAHYQNDLGIDPSMPFFEGRRKLVSQICDLLGWSVVPPAHFGFINGVPCTATEYVEGKSLVALAMEEPLLYEFVSKRLEGKTHGDEYPVLSLEVREDLAKLAVLGVLAGNKDMHMQQYVFSGSPPVSAKVFDWDITFGKRTHTFDDVYAAVPGQCIVYTQTPLQMSKAGFWPAALQLHKIRDEFLKKITPETLRQVAEGLITPEEIESLIERFDSLSKRLAEA